MARVAQPRGEHRRPQVWRPDLEMKPPVMNGRRFEDRNSHRDSWRSPAVRVSRTTPTVLRFVSVPYPTRVQPYQRTSPVIASISSYMCMRLTDSVMAHTKARPSSQPTSAGDPPCCPSE